MFLTSETRYIYNVQPFTDGQKTNTTSELGRAKAVQFQFDLNKTYFSVTEFLPLLLDQRIFLEELADIYLPSGVILEDPAEQGLVNLVGEGLIELVFDSERHIVDDPLNNESGISNRE